MNVKIGVKKKSNGVLFIDSAKHRTNKSRNVY